ncbi:uncharacterized protein LOC134236511, partial [Saccostrea cucullata]|uniref:uncharacterized protein LOC134236511 n=1 Tax=Saccostrea cuccullata TaxID=36930 RepID=UPI002ED1D25D
DEAIKTVPVSNVDTKIRTLTLQDNDTQVELTLWRELVNQSITIGDYIEVSHCIVSEWQKRKTLNTTRNTAIKLFILVLDATYKDYVVDISMIRTQLQRHRDVSQLSNEQMEDLIVQKFPFPVKFTTIGVNVQSIEL